MFFGGLFVAAAFLLGNLWYLFRTRGSMPFIPFQGQSTKRVATYLSRAVVPHRPRNFLEKISIDPQRGLLVCFETRPSSKQVPKLFGRAVYLHIWTLGQVYARSYYGIPFGQLTNSDNEVVANVYLANKTFIQLTDANIPKGNHNIKTLK